MEQSDMGNVKDLVRYRMETAKSDLQSADILLKAGELPAQNKSVMPVIMTIFILLQKRRRKSRF